MQRYVPKMYKKNIFEINYDKLKENNIKCLIFDLDNTLLRIEDTVPEKKICYFLKKLKKIFDIYIISNNSSKKRLNSVAKALDIPYVSFALKPLPFGFKKVMKKSGYKAEEICIIGDQIMTDIFGGNRLNIYTVLIEPLGEKDLKVTSFNRFLERRKLATLEKMGVFKKGAFYE